MSEPDYLDLMKDPDALQMREYEMQQCVEEIVSHAHAAIFTSQFTIAEMRVMWLRVIEKMMQSVLIERQSELTQEQMGLKH